MHCGKDPVTDQAQHFSRPFEAIVEASGSATDESTDAAYFERFHQDNADPWGLDNKWYEKRKREVLMATLPRERARRVLEIGCSTGAITARLRERADHVLAVDVSETALAKAADRLGGDPGVELRRTHLPAEYPDGQFDLVVLSEVGYYMSQSDFSQTLDRMVDSVSDGDVFVSCHYRRQHEGLPLSGESVHAQIAGRPELMQIARHVEPSFLIEVFFRRARGEN